ncbi:MAG: protein kinase [Candidatus Obscuribacter sp.]|nr:protein kinase [Candidatus Obscuribacter sp.]
MSQDPRQYSSNNDSERHNYSGDDGPFARINQGKQGSLRAGATIDDTYVVTGYLGSGSFGEVYKVRQRSTEKEYALKFLPGIDITGNALPRIQNEIKGFARLTHPNIVQVRSTGLHQGAVPYFVMDLVLGETLADWIRLDGTLSLIDALDVFIACADALHFAHQKGLIHKNFTPANVMIMGGKGSTSQRVRVMDFAIARPKTQANSALDQKQQDYQACYMSPEQCLQTRVDARSDIYALGICLFEALTGAPPLHGQTALETMTMHQEVLPPTLSDRQSGQRFPQALEDLMEQLLAKLPDNRLQSMIEVSHILSTIRQKAQPLKLEPGTRDGHRIRPPARKDKSKNGVRPIKMIAALTAGLIIGGALTGLLLQSRGLLPWQKKEKIVVRPIAPEDLDTRLTKPPEPVEAEDTEPAKITEASFFAGKKQKAGIEYNEFRFPSKQSGGTLSFVDTFDTSNFSATGSSAGGSTTGDGSVKITQVEVRGLTLVPAGAKLTYKPSSNAITNLDYLLGFRAADINGLDLSNQSADLKVFCEKALSKFKGLQSLNLTNTSADDSYIPVINSAKKLQDLDLAYSKVTTSGISKLTSLPALHHLSLSHAGKDTKTLVSLLAKADNLNDLILSDMPIKQDQIKQICKIATLVGLTLDKTETTLKDLEPILTHPYFVKIKLRNCPLEPAGTVKLLDKLQGLTEIELANKAWDDKTVKATAQRLKKAHGNANIQTEASESAQTEQAPATTAED